ncbi:MAG: RimK-like ATPgrasp N-terminal domain-containing protein, partial [Chromatiales bacterium]
MSEHILIVDKPSDWPEYFPTLSVVTAKEYLTGEEYPPQRRLRIINLCRSYRYASLGYYCSLLAEARGHRVIPTVRTIQDLSRRSIYSLMARELDAQVEAAISRQGLSPDTSRLKMWLFFGTTGFPELQDLAQQIYEGFHAPLLRIDFKYKSGWRIDGIKAVPLKSLNDEQQMVFLSALKGYMSKPWRKPKTRRHFKYDLAILHNPQEDLPPSDSEALRRFILAANELEIDAELIEKKDYGRIAEFDALFIRETTAIDHHTFRFSHRAQKE